MPALFVAHYGHRLLKGAKHWSFLLQMNDQLENFMAYQVTGSTDNYEVKEPELVSPRKSQAFMGMVQVGHIEEHRRQEFVDVIVAVPVTRGNTAWNCQNWIIEALNVAKTKGFKVDAHTLTGLQEILATV
ncbi:hypothetical protein BDN72DRAFT_834809 [Pluteus cervinus]|uniref:Uncharacterized protein n=1 Tax=Pluteus cervinus TaxID=181527 RepID=A0ACD3B6E3_9AGAR|nr:hypothetical protein BDN72DRAFT_834809 [Pluteus cervinus]